MTDRSRTDGSVVLDAPTRALVRLAARIAGGTELDVRDGLHETDTSSTPTVWVEEVILQSYLFAGFPRTLNAAREWRKGGARTADGGGRTAEGVGRDYRAEGEATCAKVYGKFYQRLRNNIGELHRELDDWMIVEGYGKVLSRPGLDLLRRELCIVAACVAAGQDRQLHSHLHGARNVGATELVIVATLEALRGVVGEENRWRAVRLWAKVRAK